MERRLTFVEAIREATDQEMARDPTVVLFGLDVDDAKAILGTTRDLARKYGAGRVFGIDRVSERLELEVQDEAVPGNAPTLSVNISGRQLMEPSVVDDVAAVLAETVVVVAPAQA